MKKLLLILALCLFSSGAFAQCNGIFPPNYVCGNASGVPAPPEAFDASSLATSSLVVGTTQITGATAGDLLGATNTSCTGTTPCLTDTGIPYGGFTTPAPYPYNFSNTSMTGAGMATGQFVVSSTQNNFFNATGVFPEIFSSSAPWAQGFYKSCVGTLSDTSGSGTCTPSSVVGHTYGVNITGYAGAPGNVFVTAATTNAGTTATALCAAIVAATSNTQIICDPTVYGGGGIFNIAWSVLLNSTISIVPYASETGTVSLTNPATKNNEDVVIYQFNHYIPGYTQQIGDGPVCIQGYSQGAPVLSWCAVITNIGGNFSANTFLQAIFNNVQYSSTIPPVNGTLNSTGGVVLSSTAAGNPNGTTSSTPKMMGVGSVCKITPLYSTRVFFEIGGIAGNTISGDGLSGTINYGTGTAPINGATGTGIGSGGTFALVNASTTQPPFTAILIATGLTPGTTYWFDVALNTVIGGTAGIGNVYCTAYEM